MLFAKTRSKGNSAVVEFRKYIKIREIVQEELLIGSDIAEECFVV